MNNNEIKNAYESETGHAYERPPIVPLPGMGRGYWRLMTLLGIVAVLVCVVSNLV